MKIAQGPRCRPLAAQRGAAADVTGYHPRKSKCCEPCPTRRQPNRGMIDRAVTPAMRRSGFRCGRWLPQDEAWNKIAPAPNAGAVSKKRSGRRSLEVPMIAERDLDPPRSPGILQRAGRGSPDSFQPPRLRASRSVGMPAERRIHPVRTKTPAVQPNSARLLFTVTHTPQSSGMPTAAQASAALASSPPRPMPKEPVGPALAAAVFA
ncbi:hypothetical protein N434_03445 [Rhizobium sp. UGM030330-04]|nr:hypothetical protein N434_03445 [Rhizobium sp. UGM030330-04]